MNIEIGVGIGSGLFAVTSSDRLVAYAWATAGNHSVSTSSIVHKTVNAVPGTSVASGVAPTVSNEKNVNVIAVIANVNGVALSPNVAIAGSISINAVVASSNSDSMIPVALTIRNVLVSGIVANSTTSAGAPTVSVGGGSSYYLQMDGVDDYFKTPFMLFNKLVIDFHPKQSVTLQKKYMELRENFGNGWFNSADDGTDYYGTSISSVYCDGVLGTNLTNFVPNDTRVTLEVNLSNLVSAPAVIFANAPTNDGFMAGNLYDMSFYNDATLVAHYDLSTGTVQDQSGNGRHATLNGGTWVVA